MSVQTTVNFFAGFGNPGDFYDDSPRRVEPFLLQSGDPTQNIFGRACTVVAGNTGGIAIVGGTGVFAGFLCDSKSVITNGTVAGGPLAATLTVPNNINVPLCNFGCIIVSLPAAAAIGDSVLYNTTTGALTTITPGGTPPGGTAFAHAVVDRFAITGASLAVIRISVVSTQA